MGRKAARPHGPACPARTGWGGGARILPLARASRPSVAGTKGPGAALGGLHGRHDCRSGTKGWHPWRSPGVERARVRAANSMRCGSPHGRCDFLLSFSACLTHRIIMPIMAEHRWLYPIDWPELSRLIRFGRAKGRCEHCRRPHGARVFHLGDERWWDADRRQWRDGRGRRVRVVGADIAVSVRITRVYIACAHLNHDPTDNGPRNLAALCQRCHMIHDAGEHRRRRWLNAYRRRALGDFLARLDAA